MAPWKQEELAIVIQLVDEIGPKWKVIEKQLGTRLPGRNIAQVRNAFLRMVHGQRMTAEGTSHNKCKQCGQPKLGHVCGGHTFGELQSIVQRESKNNYKPRSNPSKGPSFSIHAPSVDTPMSPESNHTRSMSSTASAMSSSEVSSHPTAILDSEDEIFTDSDE